jgi:hypothetical protein
MSQSSVAVKPIAIVLPQFHPIPENNLWWGEGFTEWTSVVKAKPRFKGHYQPHLPSSLGFYDLRLPEAREAQAELAKRYGIYGFCYYHYWFAGRRVLEKPVDAILATGQPDFPFMLCWANENWTRSWDGGFDKVLLAQQYSVDDFILHARHLVPYFQDPRYIRIEGKPIFAIYKDADIDAIEACLEAFRTELSRHNIEVYLCRFERRIGTDRDTARAYSLFDAGIEFQPLTRQFDLATLPTNRVHGVTRYLKPSAYYRWLRRQMGLPMQKGDQVYNYQFVVDTDLQYDFQNGWPIFPGVSPGWDNSPRRPGGGALILRDSTPDRFQTWVEGKIKRTDWDLLPQHFLFVNAWNEWAEGNHLEPCEKWGCQYLEALQRGMRDLGD